MPAKAPQYTLALSCPDRPGIVYRVAGTLAELGCNITESAQFNDPEAGRFFMRVCFVSLRSGVRRKEIEAAFAPAAAELSMDRIIVEAAARPRVVILVSKPTHCLVDLLYRVSIGELAIDPVAVVSNHRDAYQLVAAHNVPFHHLPVGAETKARQEERLLALVAEEKADFVVLARYMQILSAEACAALRGRAINIHHSFLPSFAGAAPYSQAFARGVKLIGATAHYVTAELDDGPIIEQDVARVDHAMDAAALAAMGRDIEKTVLARAVRWHAERRILVNGRKTVVFR
ncbi:MAG: formyltetrahydrofolate deformylase [Alphaproteobacteria bacterium]|nr:formyltetrahydrofolate deformylase [Alphaproteobacteria bacterium]